MTNHPFPEVPSMFKIRADENGEAILVREVDGDVFSIRKDGEQFVISIPDFKGHEAVSFKTKNWESVLRVIFESSFRHASVTIGLGFHPDTRVHDYEPPLSEQMQYGWESLDYFDDMDEYAISANAWVRGDIIKESFGDKYDPSVHAKEYDVVPYQSIQDIEALEPENGLKM